MLEHQSPKHGISWARVYLMLYFLHIMEYKAEVDPAGP